MSPRIEATDKDGIRWVVTGNSHTDLELGITALRASFAHKEEVVPSRRRGRPPKNGVAKSNEVEKTRLEAALSILRAIQKGGDAGADSSSLLSATGIDKPEAKALGPMMGMLARVLRDNRLTQNKIYITTGFSPNKRWVPQAEMNDAIKKLEETMKNQL